MSLFANKQPSRGASRKQQRQPVSGKIKQQARRVLLPVCFLVLLSGMVAGAYKSLVYLLDQPVERVAINGEFLQVDRAALVRDIEPYLVDGFIRLDIAGMQQTLLQNPWVFDATVSRRWPNQIDVTVVEQRPIARWGNTAYLNHRGELFESPVVVSDEKSLPMLSGPENSVDRVTTYYQELGQALAEKNLVLRQLELHEHGSWSVKLSNGVEIVFGSGEVMKKLQRLLLAYQVGLSADFNRIARIDMRYSNGFAVAWR